MRPWLTRRSLFSLSAAQFVHTEFQAPTTSTAGELKSFYRIASAPELFAWLKGPFLDLAYPSGSARSSSATDADLVFQTSRVVGGVRIGQLRVVRSDCTSRVTSYFANSASLSTSSAALYCYGNTRGDFASDVESTEAFGDDPNALFPFAGLNGTDTTAERALQFSSMAAVAGTAALPAPAFSIVLPRANAAHARGVLNWLDRSAYVDAHTRAVVLDLNLYNVLLRHVLALRFVFAFPSSGGVVPTLAATSAPVTKSFLFDSEQLYKSASDIVVLVFYGYFLASEVLAHTGRRRKAAALKALKWSSRYGSTARVLSLVLYVVVWLLRLVALIHFPAALPLDSDAFVTLRAFTEPLRIAQALLAVNTCLCWLVLVLLLRVSKHVDVFVRTVVIAKTKLLSLALCSALLLYGYASAFVVALGASHHAGGFESVSAATHSLLTLAIGIERSRNVASAALSRDAPIRTVLLVAFVLLHAVVLANLVLVVIYDAYRKALDDVEGELQQSAHKRVHLVYEVIKYVRALFAQLRRALASCRSKKQRTGRASRLSVVRAISSSHTFQRSAKLLSSHVGALSSLGGKLVHTVVASEREDRDDDDDEYGDEDDSGGSGDGASSRHQRSSTDASGRAIRPGTGAGRRAGDWSASGPSSSSGAGANANNEASASTKLLQGMVLQLALQNESLIRSLEEIRSDVKHLTALSAMDGTSRRVLLSPSSQSRLSGRSHSRKQSTMAQHVHAPSHLVDHVEGLEHAS